MRSPSLRAWLFMTAAACAALPVGVLGLHQARRWRDEQIAQAEKQALFAAQAAAREVGQAMDSHLKAMAVLATQLEGLPPEQLRAALKEHQRRHGGLSTLQVISAEGQLLAAVPEQSPPLEIPAGGRVSVSPISVGSDGEPAVALYLPLSDREGGFTGTVAARLPTVALAGLISQISAEFDGLDLVLLDGEHHVIAHPDEELRSTAATLRLPLYESAGPAIRQGADVAGAPTHAALAPIRMLGLDWSAIASRPAAKVQALADDAQRQTAWASMLAVGFGLLAALLLATWLSTPMAHLAAYAIKVGSGAQDVTAPRAGRWQPRELSSLMQEVTAMVAKLETSMLEVRQTHERLLRSGKMAAVGQLAAGMAHEMNNPLFIIIGFAQALKKRLAGAPNSQVKAVEGIVTAADRCKALVHDLLVLARPGSRTNELVDAQELLRRCSRAAASRAQAVGITVAVEVDGSLPLVRGSPSQLGQVLDALTANALDATPPGGQVTLGARPGKNGRVALTVADTGAGMTPDVKERMFEPFFTTRPVGQGTGLGLSIVFELVRQHEGEIHVDTQPGGGTRIVVEVPAAPVSALPHSSQSDVSKGVTP